MKKEQQEIYDKTRDLYDRKAGAKQRQGNEDVKNTFWIIALKFRKYTTFIPELKQQKNVRIDYTY